MKYGNHVTILKNRITIYDALERIFASQFKPDKMLNKTKYLGVYMDHASANIIELENRHNEAKKITSVFNHQVREQVLERSEKEAHHKEKQEEQEYYKEIGKVILNYEEVLLFGPTQAKTELLNLIRQDHHFDKIKIELRAADKMTDNQEHAFVRDFFINHQSIS